MTILGRGAALVGALSIILLSGPQAVADHSSPAWYDRPWSSAGIQNRVPPWRFHDSFPPATGRCRDHVARSCTVGASRQWNNLPQQFMRFDFERGASDYRVRNFYTRRCGDFSYQQDMVGFGDLDPGVQDRFVMETKLCKTGSVTAKNFRIKVSNDYTYYTGTGAVPQGKVDFLSFMTHEFGHASGRFNSGDGGGHFPSGNRACTTGPLSTMCPSLASGSAAWRTLESHDATAFDAAPGYN